MDATMLELVAIALKSTVKNKQSKKTLKKACLTIFTIIRDAYAGDKDFQ
jgi:hypothetical protein